MRDRLLLPCPEALDRFALHLDGELGEADGRPLEEHLDACVSCRDGAREMAALHRDLARRTAVAEMASGDPVPALLARAQWERAASARARRTAHLARREERRPWIPIAVAAGVAAGLLLALAGSHRTPAPRRAAAEPPVVAAPQPVEPPAPAPKPAPRPRVEPMPVPIREETPRVPVVEETPSTTPPPAPVAPVRETVGKVPAVAILERVEGTVFLESGSPIADGIAGGETLHVRGAAARAVVAYPDGTRLHAAGETSLSFGAGNSVSVARGEVAADVRPQVRGESFTFATAQAEVKVLGTWLAVISRPDSTLVQVEKGRVQVTRRSDRWSIPVREGQYATVEAGSLPVARPLPSNLLAEAGFEGDGTGWGGVWNRAMGRNYGGVEVREDAARSGKRALRLTTERTVGWDREVFQDFPAAPGEAFEAAGWLKTDKVGGKGVSLSLLWLSAGGNFFEDLTVSLRAKGLVLREDVVGTLAGTNDWARAASRAVAPPGTRQVRVLAFADVDPAGPAAAWLDDAMLRRVPRAGR